MVADSAVVDAHDVVADYDPDADPEDVDVAFFVAYFLLDGEIPPGTGVEYRAHFIIRLDTERLAFDVYRGTTVLDRVFPIEALGTARAFAEYLDHITGVETNSHPPIFRDASQQRREIQ